MLYQNNIGNNINNKNKYLRFCWHYTMDIQY